MLDCFLKWCAEVLYSRGMIPHLPDKDYHSGKSRVFLPSPLMRQLHMKKLPVLGNALPAVQHGISQQGRSRALSLFC